MNDTGLFQQRRIRTFVSKERASKERLGILSNRMISEIILFEDIPNRSFQALALDTKVVILRC